MKTCVLYLLVILTFLHVSTVTAIRGVSRDYEWDYILFVQHWPFTVCSQWEEKNAKNNCTLPKDDTLWTIHGIWPTKINTEGPSFCNSSWHFNATELEPILPDLEQYWTNIEANTQLSSLWKHEWRKHGTCAAVNEAFNSEVNYFQQGLTWIKDYSIGSILAQSNIKPKDTGYNIEDIYNSVKKVIQKNPIIQCVVDSDTKESFISEIRLCFNKTLELIDCDISRVESVWDYFEAYEENNLLTNCDINKPIMYLKHLPVRTAICEEKPKENGISYMEKMMKLYNTLQFLIWVTI